MYIR
jgi:flagellar motor switch protein FliG